MINKRSNWSREEHILAFNLYCKIPFGAIHVRNPAIIELASLIGRTVGSVSYKLANFSRLDPSLQARGIRGMPHGAKGEEAVWCEFSDHPEDLAYESERLLAERLGVGIEIVSNIDMTDLPRVAIERERVVKTRVNQQFFRRAVLSSYGNKCCITGLTVPDLLVASHIVPWACDAKNRLNPSNGLCLNALHDRAFDRGLICITDDLKIVLNIGLETFAGSAPEAADLILSYVGRTLARPAKFLPSPELLAEHRRIHGMN